jgi:rod shape-determining protein MreD
MIRDLVPLLIRFVGLIAVQVIVLNNVQLSGYINPFLYVLFILTLPVKFPRSAVLALAFVTGLVIDMFTDTAGMHAAATVLMAYVRPAVLRFYAPRDGYDAEAVPDIAHFGFQWFLVYTATLIFIHHLALFFIEVFRLSGFISTMSRVLLSSVATLALVLITQFLFRKSASSR